MLPVYEELFLAGGGFLPVCGLLCSVTADAKIPIMLVEKSTTHWR
jgi:hypothetical protein